jgi:hypothetical protein
MMGEGHIAGCDAKALQRIVDTIQGLRLRGEP